MQFFDEYTKKYDLSVEKQNYKYHHSYRVMANMGKIAKRLGLNDKDIELAKCIGLLHDIGRFEQIKKYQNFKDNNLGHGDFGADVIKSNNALKHFKIDEDDYNVVYKAIKNHNKYQIEDNLTEREMLFAKMIRDADKLDILYALGEKKYRRIFIEDDSKISPKIKESFYKNEMARYSDVITKNDNTIVIFSYPYDIYFDETLQILRKKKYYDKIYNRLKNKDMFKEYLDHIEKYIKERVD